MKATVKLALPGYTGNMDDMVIYYNSKLNKLIARRKGASSYVPDHRITKDIYAFARRINLSADYKKDCDKYISAYNSKNRSKGKAMSSWPSVWMKVMRAQKKLIPDLDLNTLTREQAIEANLGCISVAKAVEAGFLEKVPGHQKLTNLI
ncbi:MAG TPA: hypothetical protein PK928_07765 [Candidatus Cloacimonas sp.]|nr:hypothetical protein [Candidatus Cloacimonas sp.]